MDFDIGGFAEDEYAVDGDFEIFNYGVAENYYDAMLGEEWDLIGDADFSLIKNIALWLGYDDETKKINEKDIQRILDGSFITCNNRTFIDAIVDEKRVDLAEAYIHLGVKDIRLYILFMLYYKDDYYSVDHPMNEMNFVYKGTILNAYRSNDRDDLIKFLSNIFAELDKIYNGFNDIEKKVEFLSIIRFNIGNFKFSKDFKKISLNEVCNPGFARVLTNK